MGVFAEAVSLQANRPPHLRVSAVHCLQGLIVAQGAFTWLGLGFALHFQRSFEAALRLLLTFVLPLRYIAQSPLDNSEHFPGSREGANFS